MRKMVLMVPVLALAVGSAGACASKGYVRDRVGEVNDKVESLSRSVEGNEERTRDNERRITEVGDEATAAGRSAESARLAAEEAGTLAESVDRASRRLIFEVTVSSDQANFNFGKAQVPDEVKTEIDALVEQLKADPKNYYIEIEGHTDATGPKPYNEELGLERAEAVKRYLYEQHQVPLHKMNVISFGEDKPVAPNDSREGRAKNRRVVIKVLA